MFSQIFTPQVTSSVVAAFLASLVEFVEALTIVLAVGTTRGWRPALLGALSGAVLLTVLVALFGPSLQNIPLEQLQLVIGILLLLFGMRWLRKAVLRSSGIIALHDEEKIYAEQTSMLRGKKLTGFYDPVAFLTSFKAVVLEGVEVVFIVIATGGAAHALGPAALGATAAGVLVIGLGLVIHRPLARVPENTLKYCVGILLSAFGTFWVGEGLGYTWPGQDLSLFSLTAGFLIVSLLAVRVVRGSAPSAGSAR